MTANQRLRRALGPVSLLGLFLGGLPAVAPGQDAPAAGKAEAKDPREAAVRALSEGFVAAYNKRDADAIAALFTDDARVVEEDGGSFEGRPAIRGRFAEALADPEAPTLTLEIQGVRFPAPNVAVEDGVLVAKEMGGLRAPFTAVHVLKDGKWLTAEVRDRNEPPGSPDEGNAALAELDWMIGDWVDESHLGVVETTCKKSDDGHFLLREFTAKVRGGLIGKGVQRIGWDPVRGQVRSWVFDSDGGFNEGFWTKVGPGRWVVRASGYLRGGDPIAATSVVTRVGPDAFRWGTVDRVVGDAYLGDVEEITIVRKPPPPGAGK